MNKQSIRVLAISSTLNVLLNKCPELQSKRHEIVCQFVLSKEMEIVRLYLS